MRQSLGAVAVGWSFVSLGLTLTAPASGYCLMTTCELRPLPSACSGDRDDRGCSTEGRTLYWKDACLSFSTHRSGSVRLHIAASELEKIVSQSFEQWESVDCGMGRSPALEVTVYPQVQCDRVGFTQNGPNQNSWIFRDAQWPHGVEAEEAISLTTLTVKQSTGRILDADVELNSSANTFTLSGKDGVESRKYRCPRVGSRARSRSLRVGDEHHGARIRDGKHRCAHSRGRRRARHLCRDASQGNVASM
ncbi:MAG: hypothetical protein QM784_07080 [Polyangiaceae bacterium]